MFVSTKALLFISFGVGILQTAANPVNYRIYAHNAAEVPEVPHAGVTASALLPILATPSPALSSEASQASSSAAPVESTPEPDHDLSDLADPGASKAEPIQGINKSSTPSTNGATSIVSNHASLALVSALVVFTQLL